MNDILTLVLTVFAQIAPSLGNSAALQNIIKALIELIPILLKEYQEIAPLVKNVIAALSTNGVVTPDQLTQLSDLEARLDAEFDAAAKKAQDEDAALNK